MSDSVDRTHWENIPGHCHDVIGIWDKDNGTKAGTVCEACRRWNEMLNVEERVRELESALQEILDVGESSMGLRVPVMNKIARLALKGSKSDE